MRNILRRHGLGPAPRGGRPTWTQLWGATVTHDGSATQADGVVTDSRRSYLSRHTPRRPTREKCVPKRATCSKGRPQPPRAGRATAAKG